MVIVAPPGALGIPILATKRSLRAEATLTGKGGEPGRILAEGDVVLDSPRFRVLADVAEMQALEVAPKKKAPKEADAPEGDKAKRDGEAVDRKKDGKKKETKERPPFRITLARRRRAQVDLVGALEPAP